MILHIGIVVKSDVGEPSPIIQALYLGLISFFIISGYFFKPGRGFRENMRRRIKVLFYALVTASVCLSVICFLWCLLWGQPTNLDDLALCLERAFNLERSFLDFDIRAPDPRIPWAICGFSAGYFLHFHPARCLVVDAFFTRMDFKTADRCPFCIKQVQ